MKCKNCGKELEGKGKPSGFCSYSCYENWCKWNKEPNCECPVCHKKFYLKPSRLKKLIHKPTCSRECGAKYKSLWFSGENNPQYGVTGDKNASFKGKCIISNYGYILEYCPGHPFPHDKANQTTRVFQHRLVIEQNADKFPDKYFVVIDGKKYLKPEYSVHHINEVKTDNRLENLEIVSRSEHTHIHNMEKTIIRDDKGKIIGVVKSRELLESHSTNDNQQPSINSNINEGSTTSNRVRSDNSEDSNVAKSAVN